MSNRNASVVIRCCLCFGCAVGLVNNTLGLFANAISSSMNISVGQASLIITLENLAVAFFTPALSRFLKHFRLNKLMAAGVVTACAGLVLMTVGRLLTMYLSAIIVGIGVVMFSTVPVSYAIMTWFGQNNGLPTGIAMGASGLFGAAANVILSHLILAFGWREAMLIETVILFLLAFPSALGIRKGNAVLSGKKMETGRFQADRKCVAILFAVTVLMSYCGAINSHMSLIGTGKGFSLSFAAVMVSAAMISNILSKVAIGYAADHLSPAYACIIAFISAISGTSLLLIGQSHVIALVGAFLFGFISSTFTVGVSSLTAAIAPEEYTKLFSRVSMTVSLVYAVGAWIIGVIRDATGSYNTVLILALIAESAGIVCCMAIQKMDQDRKR